MQEASTQLGLGIDSMRQAELQLTRMPKRGRLKCGRDGTQKQVSVVRSLRSGDQGIGQEGECTPGSAKESGRW